MDWAGLHQYLVYVQYTVAGIGIVIILSGILLATIQYLKYTVTGKLMNENSMVNNIRLNLGRILILGLEFIVAADLIGTTTTPDYYAVGILAIIVAIRTLLSYSINKELMALSKE